MNWSILKKFIAKCSDVFSFSLKVQVHFCDPFILTWGTMYDGFSGQFFRVFEIIFFCFDFAIFTILHNVKAIDDLF